MLTLTRPRSPRWSLALSLTLLAACGGADPGDDAASGAPAEADSLPGYVSTPFGLYHASCVHDVGDGATVDHDGTVRQADGTAFALGACLHPVYAARAGGTPPTTNGWVEDANWTSGSWIRKLTANFNVPTTPSHRGGQTVYFFPGIEPTSGVEILQPVLAYRGSSGAWTMESWYCGPSCVHSTMVTVSPGDILAGSVLGSSCSSGGVCSTWTITTKDTTTSKSTTVTRTSDPYVFKWAFGGVLEAYSVSACTDYPKSGSISYSAVNFYDQNLALLTPKWTLSILNNTPSCSFSGTDSTHAVTLKY